MLFLAVAMISRAFLLFVTRRALHPARVRSLALDKFSRNLACDYHSGLSEWQQTICLSFYQ